MMDAVDVILMVPKDRKKGDQGRFRCPVCITGKVHWSSSGYNGHLWIACSTPECVKVMQ